MTDASVRARCDEILSWRRTHSGHVPSHTRKSGEEIRLAKQRSRLKSRCSKALGSAPSQRQLSQDEVRYYEWCLSDAAMHEDRPRYMDSAFNEAAPDMCPSTAGSITSPTQPSTIIPPASAGPRCRMPVSAVADIETAWAKSTMLHDAARCQCPLLLHDAANHPQASPEIAAAMVEEPHSDTECPAAEAHDVHVAKRASMRATAAPKAPAGKLWEQALRRADKAHAEQRATGTTTSQIELMASSVAASIRTLYDDVLAWQAEHKVQIVP